MNRGSQKGQILLIVLLILAVLVTIALSLIGRSTTNTNISTQIEESSKAFSAAEAGIEQALQSNTSISETTLVPGVKFEVEQQNIGGGSPSLNAFVLPSKTKRGSSETLWLCPHEEGDANGNGIPGELLNTGCYGSNRIELCWSSESPGIAPAVVVAIFYRNASNQLNMVRAAFDPDSSRRTSNYFIEPSDASPGLNCALGGSYDGLPLSYHQRINLNQPPFSIPPAGTTPVLLRVRPLYNNTQLAFVTPGGEFPKQGDIFIGTGTTDTRLQRSIRVEKYYRSPVSVLDYVIYSQQSPFGN